MSGTYRKVCLRHRRSRSVGAVFLDRDGVIVEDPGYLSSPDRIRYLPGAPEAIRQLNDIGIPVVVVTNQAGVGRGYYDWDAFELVQQSIEARLDSVGAWLDGIWACAYHEDGLGEYRRGDHPWRKPNPGMLLDAAQEMNLSLPDSCIVGDKVGDLEAGIAAGVRCAMHVETGYGLQDRGAVNALNSAVTSILTFPGIAAAIDHILSNNTHNLPF